MSARVTRSSRSPACTGTSSTSSGCSSSRSSTSGKVRSMSAHVEAARTEAHESTAHAAAGHEGTQHPIKIYLWIWLLLFVLSTFSYLIDYFHVQGMLRWTLIIVFMLLKAGFIVAIFMHMKWERLALK